MDEWMERHALQGALGCMLASQSPSRRHHLFAAHCKRPLGRDFQVAALPDHKLMHRLVAQTAAQPGIFTCWLDILTLRGWFWQGEGLWRWRRVAGPTSVGSARP
jgi:hypothetical protein